MKRFCLLLSVWLSSITSHALVFSFDDGWECTYTTVAPMLVSFGYKAAVSIVPGIVGTPSYMSWDQVIDLQRRGWKVWNHSMQHKNLAPMSDVEALNDVVAAQEEFALHKIYPTIFVPPYGELTISQQAKLLKHFQSIRMAWESVDYKEPIYSVLEVKSGQVPYIKARVLENQSLILLFHRVRKTSTDSYTITEDELLDILMFCFIHQIKVE